MPCSGTTGLGTVAKILPLTVAIGNERLEDVTSVWTGFPDDTDIWTIITNDEITLEVTDGNLYFTPAAGRSSISRISADTSGRPYSLENSELYFKALPMLKHDYVDAFDDWDMTFTLYDFTTGFSLIFIEIDGDSLDPTGSVLVNADGYTTSDSDTFAYDQVHHLWWRFRHDGSDVVIESAAACGTWVERLRATGFDGPLNSLTLEWAMSLDAPESPPETSGFFGDFNPAPVLRDLFLFTQIGDPLVPGDVLKILPLNVELEGSP